MLTSKSLHHPTLVLLLAVMLLIPAYLGAQSTTQSIQGLVTDATDAVIPGATVSITQLATGVTRTSTTNETGNYSFPLVPVGDYEVRCELSGFKQELVPHLRVETGAQVRQNFRLEVGNVTETVEVSATSVLLNTENAVVGRVIENKRIIELPLNGRNIAQLAVLVAGVQFGNRTGLATGSTGFPIPGSAYSVGANGQREIHQVVSLDGVDAKNPRIHITNFVPSIEAIEEFKIQTNAYSAEVGFGGGAVTTITMKSGTNEIHGTLFEFLRNDRVDSEDYFLNFERPAGTTRAPKDKLRRNQYGVVVSGPIVKNKTFWAFNWEARKERVGNVRTGWFPSDTFRSGDFSELLSGTINPETGRLFRGPIIVYDAFTGDPYANNMLPASKLHPGSLNVINLYLPHAQFRQADPFDFTVRGAIDTPIDSNQLYGRVDHYFSDKDRVFARIAYEKASQDQTTINPNFTRFVTAPSTNVASQWIHTFSPNAVNEFRFGFNIADDDTAHQRTNDPNFDMDALGIGEFRVPTDGNRKLTPREQGVPNVGFTISEQTAGNGYDRLDTFQTGNHFSVVKGTHNLKMGGEHYYVTMERGGGNNKEGVLAFSSNESGNDFASLLLGLPTRSQTPEGLALTFPRAGRFGGYVMDDWKATPKVTINYGLRFDYIGIQDDAKGLQRTLDFPGSTDIVDGRGAGFLAPDGQRLPMMVPEFVDERGSVKLMRQRLRYFMPRLGIAFRPSEKWVIRTGAGWFDNINHINTYTILNLNPPKSGSSQFLAVTDRSRTVPVVAVDGASYNVQTRIFRAGQPIVTLNDPFLTKQGVTAARGRVNVLSIPPDYYDGDVWKWSFDVQREMAYGTSVTVGYVGSKGSHTGNSIGNFNNAFQPSPDTNVNARRPWQRFYDPATPQLGIQSLGTIRYLDSFGNAFHHGLQITLDKRYSSGLSYGLAYTYSKSHGDGENGGQEGAAIQDPRDIRGSRGRFRFDQTHMLVGHYVWEIPGGNLPGALKHILGGWQSNGIVSLRSGFPFTISGGNLNTGGGDRPDRIADGELTNPTRKRWYDPTAFLRVTCNLPDRLDRCHYGSSGVNILESPGQQNLDFSLYKNFSIREGYSLQFRSEFFNAFNTPYFGQPNGVSFTTLNTLVPDGSRDAEVRSTQSPMRIIQFGLKFFF